MTVRNISTYKSITVQNDWWVWVLMFFMPRWLFGTLWYRNHYLFSAHWRSVRARKLKQEHNRCEKHIGFTSPEPRLDVHHLTYKHIWHERMSDLQVL
jgi:hypothetical protein